MDCLLLNRLDLKRIQLLVKNLTKIHHDRLMHLLPKMSPEDLDQRDFESRNLAMHENAGQIKLHLETDVDIGAIDRWRPPQREPAIRNLIQTGPLSIGQLLVLHRLLETRGLLPEETLPRGEISSLEECVLQNTLDTAQCLDDIGAIVVEVPQLTVVPLMSPPERIGPEHLILLPVRAEAPALVVGERVPVLLEERVDPRDAAVPRILQILKRQTAILCVCLLAFQRVLSPNTLRIQELRLPRLQVSIQIGDHLIFLVAEARAEVGDALVGLLGKPEVALWDQNMAHRQHAEPSKLFRRIENNRRKTRGHLRVQSDLDASLNLILALHEEIQQLCCVDHGLTEIGH
mmetsp:Transcript_29770/g.62393  ORF Transcript_29770/g.62393 Transcript_29770/m.62393 type:complete len:346 (-) Transcript_29770:4155-5192(-)